MDLFALVGKITLDDAAFREAIGKAVDSGKSFARALGSGLATASKIGAAAVGAVAAGAVGVTKKFYSGTASIAEYGDNIDKMSQKMGISAKAYQEWDAVMQHSGTSIDALKPSMKTLAQQAESGSEAFERLGISQEEVAELSQEDLFARVISGLQGMEEGSERTALATDLLGRGATELGALLNTSAEETEKMRQKVHDLGGVMGDDAVKKAAVFQDSLQDMKTAFSSLSMNLFSNFLPGLSTVMDGLTELFSGDKKKGVGMIKSGIQNMAKKLKEVMPDLLEAGGELLNAIVDGITQNLPTIIDSAVQILLALVQGIIENLPSIITAVIGMIDTIVQAINDNIEEIMEGAMQIILALAEGLIQSLPTLIPTIIEIILKIVEYLVENIDLLVDAAIAIILALADGLIAAIPKLIEKIPEIIIKLVAAIIENAPKLLEGAWELIAKLAEGLWDAAGQLWDKGVELVGKLWDGICSVFSDLVEWAGEIIDAIGEGISNVWDSIVEIGGNIISGIWEGIKGAFEWLWDKVSGFFGGIVDGVKDFLGISSPSKVFAEIGTYMAKGVGVGFDKAFPAVAGDIEDQMDGLLDFNGTSNISIGTHGYYNDLTSTGRERYAERASVDEIVYLLRQISVNMQQQIVLDTGVVAGAVDRALGRTALLKARGN